MFTKIVVGTDGSARAGRAVLRAAPDVEVIGEADGGDEAVALAERLAPHVVVMDLTMARGDGLAATLEREGVPYERFDDLHDVAEALAS